jgi:hypothetical protein
VNTVGGAHRDSVHTCTVAPPEEINGVPAGPGPAFVEIHCTHLGPAKEDKLPRIVVERYRELVRILGVYFTNLPSPYAGIECGNEEQKCVVIADHSFINNISKNGDFPNSLTDPCG